MKRLWKIQNLITLTLALTSTIIASIFLILIATWQINVQEDNLYNNLDQVSDTVVYSITSEVDKMNQASLSILYSNTIRDNFDTYIDLQTTSSKASTNSTLYESGKLLDDMVHTILTGEGSFSKIVLYDPELGTYTFGPNTAYSPNSIMDKSWYTDLINKSGRIITRPYKDIAFSSETTYNTDRAYISLIRPYYSDYNTIQGYVEIVQNYDIIFDVLSSISYDPIYEIVLLDEDNKAITLDENQAISYDNYVASLSQSTPNNTVSEYKTQSGSTDLVHLSTFDRYDYKCLIIVDKASLFQPINRYILRFFILSLFIIVIVVLISLGISRTITEPIYHLYETIKYADIADENSLADSTITTNILELNALWVALVNSHSKLRDSMNQLIMVEQREVQAKMIALQSQMNPHFLYNSLSVLTSIIDEDRYDDAKAFCENLSSMLRYASSTEAPMVSLEEELEHTHSYLECMRYRYGQDLSFSFDIPDTMLIVAIPKLTVQALVENAIKYATLKHAPWHIHIQCYMDTTRWYIKVTDNGYGFDPEVIQSLHKQLELVKAGSFIPHLSLDGMGLLNLLYRIQLHCKSSPYLQIENRHKEGCSVTVGGNKDHD